jgi:hypothetical protein
MVVNITQVINEYEEGVRRMQVVPMFSHERRMLGSDGAPNRAFFYRQFNDHAISIEFLKDIDLIRRTMQCYSCGRDMTWSERPNIHEGFHWRYQRRVAGARCNTSVHQARDPHLCISAIRYCIVIIFRFWFCASFHSHLPVIARSSVIIFRLGFQAIFFINTYL